MWVLFEVNPTGTEDKAISTGTEDEVTGDEAISAGTEDKVTEDEVISTGTKDEAMPTGTEDEPHRPYLPLYVCMGIVKFRISKTPL